MDSITNKTRVAEKRYRDKLKRDEKEIRLIDKKLKKQNKKLQKVKKIIINIIVNYKKQ